MNLRCPFLIILFFFVIPNSILGQFNISPKVDSIVNSHADSGSPGLSVVITKNNKLEYSNQIGLSNLEYNLPLKAETKFQAGFLSQQFTAYAILLLEQEGKLSLEDDIKEHFPDFNKYNYKIKIKDLLSHTSGLYDYWSLKAIAGWRNDDYFDKQLALDYAANQSELNHEPGQQAYFSNTNYLILAELVSKTTGRSFNDFVIDRIVKPLNLKNTFFNTNFNAIYSDRAYYYFDWGEGWQHENLVYYNPGSVGLITTTEDFGKWLIHINELSNSDNAIWQKMSSGVKLQNETISNFTLGFKKGMTSQGSMIYQDGFYNGYRSYMAFIIEEELGIMVWSNDMSTNSKRIAQDVVQEIIPSSEQNKGDKSKPNKKDTLISTINESGDYSTYIGYYFDNVEYHTKRVYLENDTLCLHDVDYDSHYRLESTENGRFKLLGRNTSISIEFSNDSLKRSLKIYRNNKLSESYFGYVPTEYSDLELTKFEGFYYCPLLKIGYEIEFSNGSLIANHHRAGKIKLRPTIANKFVSNEWFFSSIDFISNKKEVLGFHVNTPEIKKLYFEKYK